MTKIDVVKQLYASAAEGDWEAFASYCREDVVIREAPSTPYPGEYRGMDGFRAIFQRVFVETFAHFEAAPIDFTEGEDHVIVIVQVSGVGKKTGRPFSMPLAEVYRFEGGEVAEILPFYWDPALLDEI